MRKKIILIFLILIPFNIIYAEESQHERIGTEQEKKVKLELELSSAIQFYFFSGYNTYTIFPQVAFKLSLFNDYVFSVGQSASFLLKDINSLYIESTQKKIQINIAPFPLSFIWKPVYKSWHFQLGTVLNLPTPPWGKDKNKDLVSGTGRFGQSILFNTSYIRDPIIITGIFSYTYITPQIKNEKSAWFPCILNFGLAFTTVLNSCFSVTCSSNVTWDMGEFTNKKYLSGQSKLSESLQVQLSWQEKEWALSSYLNLSFSQMFLTPKWGITYTRVLFEK